MNTSRCFFANMSHELRTALNAVLGYTELMQDGIYGDVPDRARQVLTRIQTNGAHLLSLINDVLDISKIEAGELSLSLSDYSLRAVIETVVNATGSLAQAKGLRISTDIAADLPIGRGDERRLDAGALEHRQQRHQIHRQGRRLIRDQGLGQTISSLPLRIPAQELRLKIKRGSLKPSIRSTTRLPSKRVAPAWGFPSASGLSKCTGHDQPHIHARRRFDLQSANSSARRSANGGGVTKRILVVEDTEDNRQILRRRIERCRLRPDRGRRRRRRRADGRRIPARSRFDGIQLPLVDGYEATRRIKADPLSRHIPVIAVTSYALAQDEEKKPSPWAVAAMSPSRSARVRCSPKSANFCHDAAADAGS